MAQQNVGCDRPIRDIHCSHRRWGAASPDRPFVHLAAGSEEQGRQRGTDPPHGASAGQAAAGSPPNRTQNSSRALLLGKIALGCFNIEEGAERFPSIRWRKNQQTARGDCCANFVVVAPIGRDGTPLVEPQHDRVDQECVHGLEDISDRRRHSPGLTVFEELTDIGRIAGSPVVFWTFGMDDLGIGKGNREFVPDRRTGEVDLRGIPLENVCPIQLFPFARAAQNAG